MTKYSLHTYNIDMLMVVVLKQTDILSSKYFLCLIMQYIDENASG